jgi:nucleoside-diphosphate-sugar epimerase
VLDFTSLADTVRGIMALVDLLGQREMLPPPVHLATGRATSLGELAEMVVRLSGHEVPIVDATPRDQHVARFVGDPSRARQILGWRARTDLADGLRRMIEAFRSHRLPTSLAENGAGRHG